MSLVLYTKLISTVLMQKTQPSKPSSALSGQS